MKVLMLNSPAAMHYRGGDVVQMRKTAEALHSLDVHVSESFELEPDTAGFDLAHVFNLRTVQTTPTQVRHLKRAGLPVVLSPIYLNLSLPLWATQVITAIFTHAQDHAEVARLLEGLKSYKHKAKLPGGTVLSPELANRHRPDYDDLQRSTLQHVDHLLPNSFLEMSQLVKTLRVFDIPFTVVPYAADPLAFLDADPTPFIQKYGLRDFLLQAGRIEDCKNQLLLAYAMRELGIQLVLIGGVVQPQYLEWCRKYGPQNLRVIPHMPTDELRAAYAAARVHALPSWIETCGLVTMEAALANCNVVVSIAGCELEYYRDLAYYCDPADVGSICAAVLKAFDNYETDAPRRLRLKQLILSEYSWQRAAEATFRAYCQVLTR